MPLVIKYVTVKQKLLNNSASHGGGRQDDYLEVKANLIIEWLLQSKATEFDTTINKHTNKQQKEREEGRKNLKTERLGDS